MLISCFLLLSTLQIEGEFLELDEVYVSKFIGASQLEDKVLFAAMKGAQTELYLFHFFDGKVKLIRDGRIQVLLPFLLSDAKGFLVVPVVGNSRIYRLGREGQFQSLLRLAEVDGWRNSFQIDSVQFNDRGQLLATLTDRETQTLVLANIDLANKMLLPFLEQKKHDTFQQNWVGIGEVIYFVCRETAEITLVNPEGNRKMDLCILPPVEPVKRKKGRVGRLPFSGILGRPVLNRQKLYFPYTEYRDLEGNLLADARFLCLVLGEKGVQKRSEMVLGEYNDATLFYIWADRELVLQNKKP